jgi:SRSO17 transposase
VRSPQHFFTGANWEAEHLSRKNQELLAVKISNEEGMFTFGSNEIPKKDKDPAEVARHYCGHLGKVSNSQSGVFLGCTSERGYGLLDQQLYVPEPWFGLEYAERRKKTRFPEGLVFRTKLEIALELLEEAEATGSFKGHWVGMGSTFGTDSAFRDAIGEKYF